MLTKPCPRCKGRSRIPNLLLPGSHPCRRCDGSGVVPTWTGRLLERALARLNPEPEEDW